MNLTQRDALVALAWSLVPGLKAVIAGGFAADWKQAGDLDLWMLADPMLEKTSEVFSEMGIKRTMVSDAMPDDYSATISHAITSCMTPFMSIHVIGTEEGSTADLLRTFDISTHRWALTRYGVQIMGDKATTPYETGRVLTYRFPSSTDARVARLKDRYDIDILPYVATKVA